MNGPIGDSLPSTANIAVGNRGPETTKHGNSWQFCDMANRPPKGRVQRGEHRKSSGWLRSHPKEEHHETSLSSSGCGAVVPGLRGPGTEGRGGGERRSL